MKVETKYDLGQTVHKIWFTQKEYFNKCVTCDGEGWIPTHSEPVKCEKCNSFYGAPYPGRIRGLYPKAWHVDCALTVGQVKTESDADGMVAKYMCSETGIGSGTVHSENTLFATKDEANTECDKRNSGV